MGWMGSVLSYFQFVALHCLENLRHRWMAIKKEVRLRSYSVWMIINRYDNCIHIVIIWGFSKFLITKKLGNWIITELDILNPASYSPFSPPSKNPRCFHDFWTQVLKAPSSTPAAQLLRMPELSNRQWQQLRQAVKTLWHRIGTYNKRWQDLMVQVKNPKKVRLD